MQQVFQESSVHSRQEIQKEQALLSHSLLSIPAGEPLQAPSENSCNRIQQHIENNTFSLKVSFAILKKNNSGFHSTTLILFHEGIIQHALSARSATKAIPSWYCSSPKSQVGSFLLHTHHSQHFNEKSIFCPERC